MKPNNLVEMLDRTVKKHPNKDAFMWKEGGAYKRITYKDFWSRMMHAAAGFGYLGLKANDKVAILSNSNPMWGMTDFASASIGAVSVPIYPTLPSEQINYILNNADVKAIVVENEEQRQKVLNTHSNVEWIITMYPDNQSSYGEGELSFAQLVKYGKEHALPNWENQWRQINRDHLSTIIHTSGTTGMPKGVMLTHGNFLANIEGVQFWLIELLPEDLSLSYLPLSHVFERMAGHYMPLSVGTTIAYAESIDTIQENIQEVRPTVLTSVPRLFEKVYAKVMEEINQGTPVKKNVFNWAVKVGEERYEKYIESSFDQLILGETMSKSFLRKWKLADRLVYQKIKKKLGGRLRGMVSGGGTLNPELAKFFWAIDLPLLEGYGLTETTPVISTNPMIRAKAGTVGKVLPNIDVKVAEDGEVLVKGPSVMKGYYNDEEATSQAFVDGWFHTGDLGQFDDEYYLKIIGRKKRLLVLSTGKNVAPQISESALNDSAYIEHSVLVGDKQKYVISLIYPDYENLEIWAKGKNLQYDSYQELVEKEAALELFNKEIKEHTSNLADFEKPKKWIIIGDEWSVETGELTPKLTVKVNVVEKKYESLIKEAYGSDYSEAVKGEVVNQG